MSFPVTGYLQRAAGWLDSRLRSPALVLLYHQVADLPSDPWSLAVSPRRFAEHLDVLRRSYRPVRLEELHAALRRGDLPRRAVAVTFDDGYADNLHGARPLLEAHEVPATVFLPTAAIGQTSEFWWDELCGLLLQPGNLPRVLHLRIGDARHVWELGEAASYSEADARRHRSWRAWEPPPGVRQQLFRTLWELLHPLDEDARQRVLGELRRWARADGASRPEYRTLSWAEVSALARGGLIDIGAHTVSHASLAALPIDAQRDEIRQSKHRLEAALGRPVTGFAYPFGKRTDYTAATAALVREAGFACACTNVAGAVRKGADPFETPRVLVEDWDGEEFAGRLRRWLP